MVELIKYIACSLVDKPEEVDVRQVDHENSIVIELRVAQGDIGKVIGKQGRIAKAIRTVIKAAATKQGINVVLEII
ncbi:MAG: KH domain-containing protein [Clostridiales bacterium]|nr:KH domain-containing protein [Clostridiales bacterium]MBQ2817866.1 KH domain-containing protein [Clostridia bacterium]MBQ4637998.1 KH domain-containing protein [Clostridia bacterium]